MQHVPVSLTSSDSKVVLTTSYCYEIIARGFGEAVLTAMVDTVSTTIKIMVKGSS